MKSLKYKKLEDCEDDSCCDGLVCYNCMLDQSQFLIGLLYERMDTLEEFVSVLMKKIRIDKV